jgi:hypothetical protein
VNQLWKSSFGLSLIEAETVLLAFVVCGGLAFELLKILPEIWSTITSFF